jgi:hypothetical protein
MKCARSPVNPIGARSELNSKGDGDLTVLHPSRTLTLAGLNSSGH